MNQDHSKVESLHLKEITREYTVSANFFADCSGKSTNFPAMFEGCGLDKITETDMEMNIWYHSQYYKVPESHRAKDWDMMLAMADRPNDTHDIYGCFYGQDKSIILTTSHTVGRIDSVRNREEHEELAATATQPHIHDIIAASEPIGKFTAFRFPKMFHRHLEKWKSLPGNFVAVGDSTGAADPISGAGMTKAALEADYLHSVLASQPDLDKVPAAYQKRSAKLMDDLWVVLGELNFRYDFCTGKRPMPLVLPLMHWFSRQMSDAAHYDPTAYEYILGASHFTRHWTSLFEPKALWTVFKHSLKHGWKHNYEQTRGEHREVVTINQADDNTEVLSKVLV